MIHLYKVLLLTVLTAPPWFSLRTSQAQQIQWLSFEQLDDSLQVHPKPVFIDFYTEWCRYCRKMDKAVFTQPAVIDKMNEDYYAVRMDAETTDTICFDGQTFVNRQAGKRRRGIHELATLLGQRGRQFAPPTLVLLDKNFRVAARYFEYLSSEPLLDVLDQHAR